MSSCQGRQVRSCRSCMTANRQVRIQKPPQNEQRSGERYYRWCSTRAVEETDITKERPVGAGKFISAQLLASLLSKDVKLVADLELGITLNFLELLTAGVNQRGGHRSGDSHLAVRFVGTSRGGVGLTRAEKEAGSRSCRVFHKHEKLAARCLNTLNLEWIREFAEFD